MDACVELPSPRCVDGRVELSSPRCVSCEDVGVVCGVVCGVPRELGILDFLYFGLGGVSFGRVGRGGVGDRCISSVINIRK